MTWTLALYKFTSKNEVLPTGAPLPNPKELKADLPKVQALKFILQNAASRLRFSKLSIFKFYPARDITKIIDRLHEEPPPFRAGGRRLFEK